MIDSYQSKFSFFFVSVEKITEGITFVAKQSTPGSVVSVKGVRKAMGISVQPAAPAIPVTDHNDIESELSKLLGEDGEDTVNTFRQPPIFFMIFFNTSNKTFMNYKLLNYDCVTY